MADSPTQRTLKAVRSIDKVKAAVVERWNPHGGSKRADGTRVGNRVDLFGFIDVIAMDRQHGTITAIQATSTSNLASRLEKIRTEVWDNALHWLRSGGRIEVWGWRKYAKAVNRKTWRPTVWIVREDMDAAARMEILRIRDGRTQ